MKALAVAGLAGSLGLLATVPGHGQIAIGAAAPMGGQYRVLGEQIRAGAGMAVEDINAAGGLLGERLVLEIGDDACDADRAQDVANRMVGRDVALVVGHLCSAASIPASRVYVEEGIVQISPASSNPAFTDERPGPGIYRLCGRDDEQGAVAGAFLAERFADATVAIVHDNTVYGEGLASRTRTAMNAAGKSEALYEAYEPDESEYRDLVSRLGREGVDVLYVGGYHEDAARIVGQMREAGLDTRLMSGDALATGEFWEAAGDAGEGALMTLPPDPRMRPEAAAVVERFRADGVEPHRYVLNAYAAVQVWAQAVEAAGSLERDAVAAALDEGTFDTVLGGIAFDDRGDVTRPGYVVYEWTDDAYAYLDAS